MLTYELEPFKTRNSRSAANLVQSGDERPRFLWKSAKVFYGFYKCGDTLTLLKMCQMYRGDEITWSLVWSHHLFLNQGSGFELCCWDRSRPKQKVNIGDYQK